jgi:hypothetical protein
LPEPLAEGHHHGHGALIKILIAPDDGILLYTLP